jgi:hypothetical protein
MSDESGRSPITDGYVVPIAGLVAFAFALMTGLTASRALSGDPADVAVPVGFGVIAVLALRLRIKAMAARDDGAADPADTDE